MLTSGKYQLNEADLYKWIKNMFVFFAPALIVFLTALANGVDIKGAMVAVYLWMLNTIIDLLKKFSTDNQSPIV